MSFSRSVGQRDGVLQRETFTDVGVCKTVSIRPVPVAGHAEYPSSSGRRGECVCLQCCVMVFGRLVILCGRKNDSCLDFESRIMM